MGCDIHLVLERRHKDKWVAINTFSGHHRAKWTLKENEYDYSSPVARSRNYERFALLAGVRGDGPAPCGLPADASDTTQFLVEDYGADGHSHSWLPLGEASEIWKRTQNNLHEFAEKYPESYFFDVELSEKSNDEKNYRVIFWFDN